MNAVDDFKKVQGILNSKYNFRLNVVKSSVFWCLKKESNFQELDDHKLRSIYRELRNKSFYISIAQLHDLLNSDFSIQYDPFELFLSSLPPWDQSTDHLLQLAMTVMTDDQDYWVESLKRWFIAMAATMTHPDVINHQCIVLVGPQGIGKSTWICKLVPEYLKDYYYSGTIDPRNKDTLINLSECFLVDLDELENLTKHESGALKELITKTTFKLRKPYGRVNESFVRRASFIGSVNHLGFLNDPSGSRRFLCFEVDKIDYKHKINICDCFSQANFLYQRGDKHWFDGIEIQNIMVKNQKFETVTIEEELLLKHFDQGTKDKNGGWSTSEIRNYLIEKNPGYTQISLRKLGEILRKHQFLRYKNSQNIYVYAVKPRK